MPPPAAATKNVFDGLGMPTTSATRPSKFAGPTVRQRKPASVSESSVCASAVAAPLVTARPARSETKRKRCIRTPRGGTRNGVLRRYSYGASFGSVEAATHLKIAAGAGVLAKVPNVPVSSHVTSDVLDALEINPSAASGSHSGPHPRHPVCRTGGAGRTHHWQGPSAGRRGPSPPRRRQRARRGARHHR